MTPLTPYERNKINMLEQDFSPESDPGNKPVIGLDCIKMGTNKYIMPVIYFLRLF